MPTEQKPLKERIAALKAKRNEISREAKVRVASAYTVAKTLAPTAPKEVQAAIASALLTIPSTKILTAAVKQTAINNYYTKMADDLRSIHKLEMNDLMEKPEVLSKLKSELESELKGGAKSAAVKTADDRGECGKQPETYTDPSIGITPAEMDASKAADREADTVDKSLGDKKAAVKAAAACVCGKADCANCKKASEKTAHEGCTGPNDCKTCKAAAEAQAKVSSVTKKADDAPIMEEAPADAPAADAAPAEVPGEEAAPAGDAIAPEVQGEIVIDSEAKEEIKEQIDAAATAIQNLKEEIDETAKEDGEELLELTDGLDEGENDIEMGGEDELDIENIFSDDNLNEHKGALANEGEGSGEEITFDNEPTSAETMEAALEGEEVVGSAADFFASDDETSGLDVLMASAHSAAAGDAGVVKPGQLVDEFEAGELGGKEVDNESDHDEDIFGDVLKTLKPEDYNVGKPREQQDDVKAPEPVKGGKMSAKTPAAKTASKPIRRLKVSEPTTAKNASALSGLIFMDEEDYR